MGTLSAARFVTAGGTDAALARVAATTILHVGVAVERQPSPDCTKPVAINGGDGGNWPAMQRSATGTCGAVWNDSVVIKGDDPSIDPSLRFRHGFDAQSAYADSFHRDTAGNAATYVTGGVCVSRICPDSTAVLRSPDGGQGWSQVALLPLIEHAHMTSTPPSAKNSTGTMFIFGCAAHPRDTSTGYPTLFWSYDGFATAPHVAQLTDAPCMTAQLSMVADGQLPGHIPTGITRVSATSPNVGLNDEAVRVTFPADEYGRVVLQVATVDVPINDPTRLPVVTIDKTIRGDGPHDSILLASFIEPDAFDWPSSLDLPDTALLYWYETERPRHRAPHPVARARGVDTVRYAVVRGRADWSELRPLATSFGDKEIRWSPDCPVGSACIGDFQDGSYYLHLNSNQTSLRFFAVWPQQDADLGIRAHYTVVAVDGPSLPPPPP